MHSLAEHYEALQPKLYTFFLMKTSSIAVAEDLTQDVFYEASKSIHQFKGDAAISTWLFSIARHLLANYYRSKKFEQTATDKLQLASNLKQSLSTENAYELKVEVIQLQKQIALLEETTKEIVLLRLYGELPFADIGELIGKTENYARVTYHRARQKIKREMEGNEV